ncbi:hypothetical protein WICANDRAFT_80742 [Wickerhamomyces anomalus NRRL Y-366-8]|uniref:Uncharacterized protein n=1 Tax=Wickerhamomyces anomalus (strain ATCC 58044 / CBS 1984 / NCYC 433 / NRRL Y-366-8) TaxID=683960 RepID=A0A1E3NW15_WICAA|nr:uncharacterized protein WICANDRAFT_80742 [Wickerhamomyces anomalus NRRL Y-366-8]ODQ57399.1 hypothetical protein WICANDRAFT_80742 [Wickerhamomyces anomalus NRRL Y-366-8]
MESLTVSEYVDPVLSVVGKEEKINPQTIQSLTSNFPSYYSKITSFCSSALKIYKNLLNLEYELNSWEFMTLKASININFNHNFSTTTRNFDIKIAKKVIDRCNFIDDEINKLLNYKLKIINNFISSLTIQEYLSDPGCLLLKIYFKIINLKNSIVEKISISYTKSKLLIISFELKQITDMIEKEENPIVEDNTDFQSTLEGYKDFVTVLINQLDQAVQEKDSDQIQECLEVLNDVEKMYESVRLNFFINEEYAEWEQDNYYIQSNRERELEQELAKERELSRSRSISPSPSSQTSLNEELLSSSTSPPSNSSSKFLNLHSSQELPGHHHLSRRGSISSTTSSVATLNRQPTTISEELPYLLQAFDEAKQLEQELSTYQTPRTPTSSQQQQQQQAMKKLQPIHNQDKRRSNLQTFNIPNVGFNNNLLNSIYGLTPKSSTPSTPSHLNHHHHNEVD